MEIHCKNYKLYLNLPEAYLTSVLLPEHAHTDIHKMSVRFDRKLREGECEGLD